MRSVEPFDSAYGSTQSRPPMLSEIESSEKVQTSADAAGVGLRLETAKNRAIIEASLRVDMALILLLLNCFVCAVQVILEINFNGK